jgi:hypothetical protein
MINSLEGRDFVTESHILRDSYDGAAKTAVVARPIRMGRT